MEDNMLVHILEIDNEEYVIVDAIQNGKNKYLFLANKNDASDVCIRKIVKEDKVEVVDKLDSEEELEEVLFLFNEKHKEEEGKDEK